MRAMVCFTQCIACSWGSTYRSAFVSSWTARSISMRDFSSRPSSLMEDGSSPKKRGNRAEKKRSTVFRIVSERPI